MVIIVEGIDRVGKTTLCNALSKKLNVPIYKHDISHMDYSKMDNMNETDKMSHMLTLCEMFNGNIIFDRFHWSDYVYGIIDRHYSVVSATNNLSYLNKRLNDLNAIIVYVQPNNIKLSSDEHGSDLSHHLSLMNYCYETSTVKMFKCTYDTIDNVIEEIKEYEDRI